MSLIDTCQRFKLNNFVEGKKEQKVVNTHGLGEVSVSSLLFLSFLPCLSRVPHSMDQSIHELTRSGMSIFRFLEC